MVNLKKAISDAPAGGSVLLRMLRSLQCRATIVVVALTLTVTGAVSGYLVRASLRATRDLQDEEVHRLASLVARAAADPLAHGESSDLVELSEEAANGSPLLYVAFTDPQGTVIAQAGYLSTHPLDWLESNGMSRPPTPGVPVCYPATETMPAFLDVVYPVSRELDDDTGEPTAELAGYVRVGMSIHQWQQSMASTLDLLIGVGIIAIILVIPLGFMVVRRIVAPLEEVSQAMRTFSEGKLDARSQVRRTDEVGTLANAFNQMADEHQNAHERILRLNTELEERVAERTLQLRELVSREPLTELYNRRYFGEALERCFAEAVRYDTDLSCIMIDLDDFKPVNDQHGHAKGDEVILMAAESIRRQLRSADLAARYGGDEFVVLLPQTDAARAGVLASRISEDFAAAISEQRPTLYVTMSMGIASLKCLANVTPDELVREADEALYKAKAAGKKCVRLAGEAQTALEDQPVLSGGCQDGS